MPDVKAFMNEEIGSSHELLLDKLPQIVAEQMSCEVDGEYYKLDPKQEIDLLLFYDSARIQSGSGIHLQSKSDVIIEIAAYDYDDRMRNISERITNVATRVKEMLGNRHKVSITFIPIRQDCWAGI